MAEKREIIIVGGGPAGYVSAILGAQLGAKPTIIERAAWGGVCTNEGCIPTKTYVTAANNYNLVKNPNKWGIRAENQGFDWEFILSNKNKVVTRLSKGIEFLLKKNEIEFINGEANFISPTQLEVDTRNGLDKYEFNNLIIATGSKSRLIPVPGIDSEGIWDSSDALSAESIPQNLLIIGGGVIGVEMAYVFQSFGAQVTIVEILPEILPGFDTEIAEMLRKQLTRLGVKIELQTTISEVNEELDGFLVKIGEDNYKFEKVLLAVGREIYDRNVLENIGIDFENGWVKTNRELQTSHSHIWAAGDVAGGPWLAHKASYDGEIAMANILGKHYEVDYSAVPSAVFSVLEIGTIGFTKSTAEEAGFKVLEGKFPYMASGRARAAGEIEGFIKIVANKENDELLGIHIIGKDATELLGMGSILLTNKMKLNELNDSIFAHPTLSEMIREAGLGAIGKAINI